MFLFCFCVVDFIGNPTTYTRLNKQRSKRTKKERLPKGRGTNGTRGPMQGTLSENFKIIKYTNKKFLKNVYTVLGLMAWTVSHRGPGANQVSIED